MEAPYIVGHYKCDGFYDRCRRQLHLHVNSLCRKPPRLWGSGTIILTGYKAKSSLEKGFSKELFSTTAPHREYLEEVIRGSLSREHEQHLLYQPARIGNFFRVLTYTAIAHEPRYFV